MFRVDVKPYYTETVN